MPRYRKPKVTEYYDIIEAWESLYILIETIDKDFKKMISRGTKRRAINARAGLKYAKNLIDEIILASYIHQKKLRGRRIKKHGNTYGNGIKAMHEKRGITRKN